jgi:hypothetical protein
MNAAEIARHAADLVSGDRNASHGEAHVNFENIRALWSAYLDRELTAVDVALMMVLLKVARTKAGRHNPDDYVDAVGYAALAGELAGGTG